MKILVNALSGIGDALMFTPSLLKLKEDFPDSQIDILVMYKGVKDIFEKLPEVNQIYYWDFLNRKKFASLLFVIGLRKKYDISINVYPSNRKEYNLISSLIGAKIRASIKYLRKDFSNLGFLNNIRLTENDDLHNVQENILLCEKITGVKSSEIAPLQIKFSNKEMQYAEKFLKENGIQENKIVIGFHPGCSTLKNHDKRRWATEKFSSLARLLIANHNAEILIFGGPEEKYLKEEILKGTNSTSVKAVETTTLLETAAIMKRCNIFITNDSSLMHVASALQLNVVAVIGPTNVNYIHPWKTKHKIASLNLECSPCFYYSPKPLTCSRNDVKFKCIKELTADMVYEKTKMFLK